MDACNLQILRNAFPNPPTQGAIGEPPNAYLQELHEDYILENVDPLSQLERMQLRDACQNSQNSDLALYAAVMAWGGRNMNNYRLTLQHPSRDNLIALIQYIRRTNDSREEVFKQTHTRCHHIKGLGISFFTKLMYFLRSRADAYILDQFTAKSTILLCKESGIRINASGMPDPQTNHRQYEKFCVCIENIADQFGKPWSPDTVEQALFGKNTAWRTYVKHTFPKKKKHTVPQNKPTNLLEENSYPPPPRQANHDRTNKPSPERSRMPTLYLNNEPRFYIGIKANQSGKNIGYISRSITRRGGEICVYQQLLEIFRNAGIQEELSPTNMQHGGPVRQHAGNLAMPTNSKNPKAALRFLSMYFNLIEINPR